MGSGLARYADAVALPTLTSDRARVVLLAMCLTAKDTDLHPNYRAGSDRLARSLGFPIQEPDPDFDGPYRAVSEAGRRATARALRELVDAGFIQQAEGTPRSWKRRWHITLPGWERYKPRNEPAIDGASADTAPEAARPP